MTGLKTELFELEINVKQLTFMNKDGTANELDFAILKTIQTSTMKRRSQFKIFLVEIIILKVLTKSVCQGTLTIVMHMSGSQLT